MRYVDCAGKELSRDDWFACLCDPECSIVRRTRVGMRQYVETSWIGLEIEGDKQPGNFVVMTYTETANMEPPSKFGRRVYGWYATEAEALAAHAEACAKRQKEIRNGGEDGNSLD